MPGALAYPMNTRRWNWGYESEPEPHLDNRRLNCPRGKGLGGSSSINGLVYVRGNALDFERWQNEEGARGWGYADVLPYFKRAEVRAEGGNEYRGGDGPLSTAYGALRNPLHQAWLDAAQEAGYSLTEDYNGFRQEGFGRMDMTVRNGTRCSAAKAYLYPSRKRANLRVVQMPSQPACCLKENAPWESNSRMADDCRRSARSVRSFSRAGRSIRSSCSSFPGSGQRKSWLNLGSR